MGGILSSKLHRACNPFLESAWVAVNFCPDKRVRIGTQTPTLAWAPPLSPSLFEPQCSALCKAVAPPTSSAGVSILRTHRAAPPRARHSRLLRLPIGQKRFSSRPSAGQSRFQDCQPGAEQRLLRIGWKRGPSRARRAPIARLGQSGRDEDREGVGPRVATLPNGDPGWEPGGRT